MNRNRAIVLMVIQIAVVLSVAGKYLYERKTCPRVWVKAAQYDPNTPLRGRYLALRLQVDACALPKDKKYSQFAIGPASVSSASWQWSVRPVVRDGKLVAVLAGERDRPEDTQELTVWGYRSCDQALLSKGVDYFIADTARTRFPLSKEQELWVEVTVPPMGPPRPIQLATSQNGTFTPLKLD
jgi:hypothetical protein